MIALGRPLDPSWRTNRAVLWLMPALAVVGAGLAWWNGLDGAAVAVAALRASLLGFGAWAVGRELAPDDQWAAFLAMGIALTTLLNVPEPGFGLLFLALFLARVLNRSTGLDPTPVDAAGVLALAGYVSWSGATPWPLFFCAVTFAWSAFRLGGPRWLAWPGMIALLGAGAALAWLGPGIGTGEPLSRHGVILPAIFGLGFLVALITTREVVSPGDHDDRPLAPPRVRAGMWIALGLAVSSLAQGSPQASAGVALWSVLGGVAVGRLLWSARQVLR
ncbi:MAG: hypothetical protein V2I57_16345 [Xanthomonadales bacterium]|jgi:hypothetical protein|nr:hypothetical protein [Xanthomonadales bacterium]